jgi:predicted site-specific integrase-resolvase
MVGDEAPAATAVAQRVGWAVSKIERFSPNGPISLVAAENPSWTNPAASVPPWLQCSIQIVCQRVDSDKVRQINELSRVAEEPGGWLDSIRRQQA